MLLLHYRRSVEVYNHPHSDSGLSSIMLCDEFKFVNGTH